MDITMGLPSGAEVDEVGAALREWQSAPVSGQLHPGDVGWFWRFGTAAVTAGLRVWRRGSTMVAVGLLDGQDLIRLGLAPDARQDRELAVRIADDLNDPAREVLGEGDVAAEVPDGALLHETLSQRGWGTGEAWTPLSRELTDPVEDCGDQIEIVGPQRAAVRTALQRSGFAGSTFTTERWEAMAAGPLYGQARCLMVIADRDPVAAATVWSAGPGRPGLVEPVAVHPDHRGHGYGTAVSRAAAATLRSLGSSRAVVATPSANVAAVATYRSAGFTVLSEIHDRTLARRGPGPGIVETTESREQQRRFASVKQPYACA